MDPLLVAAAQTLARRPGRQRMAEDAFYRTHGRPALGRAMPAAPAIAALAAVVIVILGVA